MKPIPSHARLLGAAVIIMVLSHNSHAGGPPLTLIWAPSEHEDAATGQLTPQLIANVTLRDGYSIQAVASCDDSLANAQTGSDEDINFSAFQGDNGTDLLWDNSAVILTYNVDNFPQQTTQVDEKYSNAAMVEVAYSDMSTAQHFTVDLPLANGADPELDLNPADPVMRSFTEICEKQFKADYPPQAPTAPAAPVAPTAPQTGTGA
jgi:hypothetical protein